MRAKHLILIALALALAACDDDSATSPDATVPLSDLGPRLVIEPESGPIGTFFEVHVALDAKQVVDLGQYDLVVPWPTRSATLRVDADETGRMQVDRVGSFDVRATIRPPEGSDEADVVLTASLEVTGGTPDGSLELIEIPEGLFLQGFPERRAFEGYTPQRSVYLSKYSIGRAEVTNAAFLETLEWAVSQGRAEVFGHLIVSDEGPLRIVVAEIDNGDILVAGTSFLLDPDLQLHPARGVTWLGAALWCNWQSERDGLEPAYQHSSIKQPFADYDLPYLECDFSKSGYRLPTEAEWEKAARGGETLPTGPNPAPSRWYPWEGDDYWVHLSGDLGYLANLWEVLGPQSTPVGSFPRGRSPYGLDDLIGNVSEWVNDWYDRNYYSYAENEDPRGPAESPTDFPSEYLTKVWRGAPFFEWVMYMETGCSSRIARKYTDGPLSLGFRVARSD